MEENTLVPILKKDRYVFIDVLRGLSVLWMIETHVMDAVMHPDFKHGLIYYLFDLSNGFVSVAFLFFAGSGFWIAATRKAETYRHFEKPLWTYLKRLGLILILAYWLHLSFLSIRSVSNLSLNALLQFFECDILQAIVYSSLFALILLLLIKNLNALKYIYGLIAIFVFLYSPFVWNTDPTQYLPAFLAPLISKYPISKFPLLPWSGYFFAGIFSAGVFFQAKDKMKVAKIYLILGTIFLFLLYFTKTYTDFYPGYQDWWHISPFYLLFRTSFVVAAFGLFFILEKYYNNKKVGEILTLTGQESLFIYIFHLLIVYGSIINHGFNFYIGQHLGPFETALLILGLWFVSYSVTLMWHIIKTKEQKTAHLVMTSIFVLFLIILIVRPF